MTADVFVVFEDLPTSLRAFVRENADCTYTIVCNSRLNAEAQRAAIEHEYRHIRDGDLWSQTDADQIESEAHKTDRY